MVPPSQECWFLSSQSLDFFPNFRHVLGAEYCRGKGLIKMFQFFFETNYALDLRCSNSVPNFGGYVRYVERDYLAMICDASRELIELPILVAKTVIILAGLLGGMLVDHDGDG